jgi:hypothetical protein
MGRNVSMPVVVLEDGKKPHQEKPTLQIDPN